MKIGILTFHSQLNYGGVLQCWALKKVLEGMGHDVVVVDRWLNAKNTYLCGRYSSFSKKEWVKLFVRGLFGTEHFGLFRRYKNTRRFVRKLGLTPYHFYEWKDAPKDLEVDCLVVGSDQVWHGGDWGYPNPYPYLLEGAPHVRAIAYAASFGMKSLPLEYDYASGFKRFSAISVREEDAVPLVVNAGYPNPVSHVVDPTLLLSPEEWHRFVKPQRKDRTLVCYFLEENISQMVSILEPWARKNGWRVNILCDRGRFNRPVPRSFSQMVRRLRDFVSSVQVRTEYGPEEFVYAFSRADACVTDSFHAIVFSSIFDVNARFLRPTSEKRKSMFARIEGFARQYVSGELVANDIDGALAAILNGPRISFRQEDIAIQRQRSDSWLRDAINSCPTD